MHRVTACAFALLTVLMSGFPVTATAAALSNRSVPRILSAAWGTDGGVGCQPGARGLDNIPVDFNWLIRRSTIQAADFQIVRSDGSIAIPTCALQFPASAPDEAQTVNLIGDFGASVTGPTLVAVRVVGALEGHGPGGSRWRPLPGLPQSKVSPLSGGPYIADAWTLTPAIWHGDPDHRTVDKTFVRVVWSNGLTAYPTGAEIGPAVVASYRAIYTLLSGKVIAFAPLAVAVHPQAKVANDDNMHDLCLPRVPRGARLTGVSISGGLIQDPNGDANVPQKFRLPRPVRPTRRGGAPASNASVGSALGLRSLMGI
jgi:hypothetical protein